jgi:hypothetical protein
MPTHSVQHLESKLHVEFDTWVCICHDSPTGGGRYWLSVGAQPSDTVRRLLNKAGILPAPPIPHMHKKGPNP